MFKNVYIRGAEFGVIISTLAYLKKPQKIKRWVAAEHYVKLLPYLLQEFLAELMVSRHEKRDSQLMELNAWTQSTGLPRNMV